jgi:hypothetical protein
MTKPTPTPLDLAHANREIRSVVAALRSQAAGRLLAGQWHDLMGLARRLEALLPLPLDGSDRGESRG